MGTSRSGEIAGAFNPGRGPSGISLEGAFSPGRDSAGLGVSRSNSPSMMEMAQQYSSRREAMAPVVEEVAAVYSMPDAEQDAFYRAQYETQGYIPEAGFASVYQEPNALREVEVGGTYHLVPKSWRGGLPYEGATIDPFRTAVGSFRSSGSPRRVARLENSSAGMYEGSSRNTSRVQEFAEGSQAFNAIQRLQQAGREMRDSDYSTSFGEYAAGGLPSLKVNSGVMQPTWRRNRGGLIPSRTRDYRGGGLVNPRMNRYQAGGPVGSPMSMDPMGGMGPPPMGGPPMAPPPMGGSPMGMDPMMQGLGSAPAAMGMQEPPSAFPGLGNDQLAQVASSMPPEQISLVVEEVKLALMGRHPQGEQLLTVVNQMFPGMIEEVAVSLQGTADGMTDSELALLAPGEYVVDSRTVSDLGNGSTAAGGQAMDKMVQEIRMANTGSPQQPPAMDPMAFNPMGNMG